MFNSTMLPLVDGPCTFHRPAQRATATIATSSPRSEEWGSGVNPSNLSFLLRNCLRCCNNADVRDSSLFHNPEEKETSAFSEVWGRRSACFFLVEQVRSFVIGNSLFLFCIVGDGSSILLLGDAGIQAGTQTLTCASR